MTKKHIIINKLLMGDGSGSMDCNASEALGVKSMGDAATETFGHENEEKGGQGISLPDTTGGGEGKGGNAINENREEGGRYKAHDPSDPGGAEAIGS